MKVIKPSLVGWLVLVASAWAQTFVQVSSLCSHNTQTSFPVTFPNVQTAGNLNVVVVGWNDIVSTVNSVTDTQANSYVRAIGPQRGTVISQSIYYAKNIKPGSNTVTITFNQAPYIPDFRILEYSGLDQTAPLDVVAGAAGTGTAASSGVGLVTSTAKELVFGGGTTTNGMSVGSGFTLRVYTSPCSDIAEDKTVTSTGAYSAMAGNSSSTGSWVMQMATFKVAGSTPPPPIVPGQNQVMSKSLSVKVWKGQVTLTWGASTTPNVTYSVYRGTVSGGPYTKLTSGLAVLTYLDQLPGKGTFYYVATASGLVNGIMTESGYSNQATVVVQ